jgi:hypothetical protein
VTVSNEPQPVPSAEAVKDTLAKIKEIYADQYAAAKLPEQRSALAGQLLTVARQTTGDPVSRYGLLQEVRNLAAEAGNLTTLRAALLALTVEFQVSESQTFVDGWNEFVKRPRDAAMYRTLYDEAGLLFDEAVTEARFDDAKRYGDFAAATAGRLKDQALTKSSNERNTALATRRKEWDAVKAANEKLATAPDDAESNLVVGRFLALTAADWRRAFPMLAKGNDEVWKALAEKSLAGAADPKAQSLVGDAWYDAAQAAKAQQKSELLAGMTYWYGLAAPSLTGLDRSRIDKRLNDAASLIPQRKIPSTTLSSGGDPSPGGPNALNQGVVPTRTFGDTKP